MTTTNTNRALALSINDTFISEALSLAATLMALYPDVTYHEALLEAKRLTGRGMLCTLLQPSSQPS